VVCGGRCVGLRARWPEAKAQLQADLRAEQFRFEVLSRITLPTGEEVDLWSARDVLVLKGLALVLGGRLPFSRRCVHVKGQGGRRRRYGRSWRSCRSIGLC
jgi:hypothetical protein